ncbi:dolichyl-diphosphooligosaccharide--protein glycosyltransferase subunit 1A [Euphorbia lathyris]|uniref:dolichyl-diphosphooligosaccharide--protein glycosyltransferase subunit 1A n=1 Tax=Euphorbia lathyris TaxID=212925 RepID=UPI003313675A
MGFRFFSLLLLTIAVLSTPVLSDLILSKVDRRIDLTSQIVRITSTLKVENAGPGSVSELLLTFPELQAKNLAFLSAKTVEGKGKTKSYGVNLPARNVNPKGMPPKLNAYSISFPKELGEGDSLTLEVLAVLARTLQPYPEKITQADIQLVLFQDTAQYLSPYVVKVQSVSVKLPDARIESYTKLENTKVHGSEIKYGPYENLPPYSFSPIIIHFETNTPFAVAHELVREIEISHWGNVQVTEYYNIVHGGAKSKGEFSRLDYQARPNIRGATAIKFFVATLPARAHSIYYRDEIGNISTSHLSSDSSKTELIIEPRYPMIGGWRTAFTIGYGLPLADFLFQSAKQRYLNFPFGSPMHELVIDNLIVKVVLPEGSKFQYVSTPFPVTERQETKLSHLDIAGRPVIVLEKSNAVPEHYQNFQVYYKFSKLSMLREPLMLIFGFFLLFVACIVYVHVDLSISKSSASYLAKLQWDEVRATVQQVESIINQCLAAHDKLEASLRDLSRVGDVQACKSARKLADSLLKEYSKELKPLLAFLQSSPTAAHIMPKVEELVAKEKELQERLMAKHSTIVDCYEKKLGGREIENRVSPVQQKVIALRQDIEDLLEYINGI